MPTRTTSWIMAGLIFAACLATAPAPATAWGDLGHTIVCGIAFQELNEKARQEVLRLIALDTEFRFRGFPDSCTWPDHPRKRGGEHFVNVARTFTTFAMAHCPIASACLLTAIPQDVQVLSTTTDDAAKLASLKFLGHWVGDLHQPLHVSFKDDQGGNKIKESGPCRNSLHSVWDGCILQHHLGTQASDIANDLHDQVTDEERTTWRVTPIHEWANESLRITRQPSVRYCVRVGTTCRYTKDRVVYEEGQPEKTVAVTTAYLDAHGPIIADRLKRAGVRLGHLLNEALGK